TKRRPDIGENEVANGQSNPTKLLYCSDWTPIPEAISDRPSENNDQVLEVISNTGNALSEDNGEIPEKVLNNVSLENSESLVVVIDAAAPDNDVESPGAVSYADNYGEGTYTVITPSVTIGHFNEEILYWPSYESTYKKIKNEKKWYLSSGRSIEDVLYAYASQLNYKQPAHSFIVDT
ncbi:25731_t:CDS:2, partial [Racocetra persica]